HVTAEIRQGSAGRDIDLTTRGAGALQMLAQHTATFNGRVTADAAGFISGAGSDTSPTILSHVTAAIGEDVVVTARSMQIDAINRIDKPALAGGASNTDGSAKALVSGAKSTSTSRMELTTLVDIGEDAQLTVTGATSNAPVMVMRAFNQIDAQEKVTFEAAGLGAGVTVDTNLLAYVDIARVDVGAGARLQSSGQIVMSARGAGTLDIQANAEANGGVGVVTGTSTVDVRPVNEILVRQDARLLANGDIWLSAGRSGDYVSDWYALEARIDSYSSAAIPIDDIDANAIVFQNNLVSIAGGALLQTAGEARLHAERLGVNQTKSGAAGHSWAANLFSAPSEFEKGDALAEAHGVVRNDGTVQTGTRRQQNLTITAWELQHPGIRGYVFTDGSAENALATARNGNAMAGVTFALVYDGVSRDIAVLAGDFGTADQLRAHVQAAVDAVLGGGKVVVLLDDAGALGFDLPAVTFGNPAAAQDATEARLRAGGVDAHQISFVYDGQPLTVQITAFNGSDTEVTAHIQQAIDRAMTADGTRYGNAGDIHVVRIGNQIQYELGPYARTYHTLGRFEPGFQVGSITVQSQLLDEIAFAEGEIAKYPGNATLVAFYQSEIDRITGELAELNLIETGSGQAVGASKSQLSVTINPINANAGAIDVRGDQIVGKGRWIAPGDAGVSIINATPAFLQLRGISISQSNGGLFANGVAVDSLAEILASNVDSVSFDNLIDVVGDGWSAEMPRFQTPLPSAGGAAPEIVVKNTLNVTQDGTGRYTWNDIIVLGNDGDPDGDGIIQLDANEGYGIVGPTSNLTLATPQFGKGDIRIFGSIIAAQQTIVAGGTLFVDGVSQLEVDGKPYTAWKDVTYGGFGYNSSGVPAGSTYWVEGATPQEAASVFSQPPGGGLTIEATGLYADRIIINAEYVNINGILQSGYDKYTLVLGDATAQEITRLLKSTTSSRFFLEQTSTASKHFLVYYNRATESIEIEDLAVSGGYIDITGNILNTANGRIRSLGGYGEIEVVNNTDYNLVVKDLDASRRGAGVVLIKDKAKFEQTPPTPDFTAGAAGSSSAVVRTGDLVRQGDVYYHFIEQADGDPVTRTLNLNAQDYSDRTRWAVHNVHTTLYEMSALGLKITTDDGNGPSVSNDTAYQLGEDVNYDTASGWRFGWSVGLTQKENFYARKVETAWLFIPTGSDYDGPWDNTEVEKQPTLKEEAGYYYFDPANTTAYDYRQDVKVTSDTGTVIQKKVKTTWYGTTTITAIYTRSVGKDITHTHSVEADRDIKIEFMGRDEGRITVDSNGKGKVTVLGAIANPTGVTQVSSGSSIETVGPEAYVGGRYVDLDAQSGIGQSAVQPVATRVTDSQTHFDPSDYSYTGVGGLKARTVDGGIYIRENLGDLPVDRVEAVHGGDVVITAPGAILVGKQTTSTTDTHYQGLVQGGIIALVSGGEITRSVIGTAPEGSLLVSDSGGSYYVEHVGSGGIGNSIATPLQINTGNLLSSRLSVVSTGNVFLREIEGNLRVQKINAGGSVYVQVHSGSLIDGNSTETRDQRTYEELKGGVWSDLALTRDLGALDKIEAAKVTLRSAREAEYQQYWNYRQNQPDHGAAFDLAYQVRLNAYERAWWLDYYAQNPVDGQTAQQSIAALEADRTAQYRALHLKYGSYGDTYQASSILELATIASGDRITFGAAHGLATGTEVVYRHGGNAAIALQSGARLVDGGVYYVIATDDANQLKLAASKTDALAGIALTFAAQTLAVTSGAQTLRTGFVYKLSAEEEGTLTSGFKVWTEEELLYSVSAGLLKAVSDTTITVEDPNIVGSSVQLDVAGAVGEPSGVLDIDLAKLRLPPAT
ncbi:MAG TPA: hypothetical protein VIR33_02410, partial [Thermopolyspora sp.]